MGYLGNRPDAFQYTSTSYQSLSGDGVTTTFTLSRQVSANGDIEVVVNNVPQEPGVAYYVTNLTNLIFTAAPSAAANNIYIVYRSYVQSGIAPAANTVTTSAIAANTIQPWQLTNSLLNPIVNTFTANGTSTTYTLSFAPPSANAVVVTVNGITQNHPANYSTNDTVLTFTDPPAAASVIRVLQQAMIGTSIVPIDGSVTTSKLADGSVTTSKLASGVTLSSANLSGGSINNMTIGGTTANTGAFTTLSASGVATFSAGSAAAPALTTTGDTNTGLFFPAADTIAFSEGGVESMRIDSSGNVGIGTSSPTTRLGFGAHIPANGQTINVFESGNTRSGIGVVSGVFRHYTDSGSVQSFGQVSTSDGSTYTERMRIDSAGSVGIGTTPSAWSGLGGKVLQNDRLSMVGVAGNSYIGNNWYSNGSANFYIASAAACQIRMADNTIIFNRAASGTAGNTFSWSESMRINPSGDLFVGVNDYQVSGGERLSVRGLTSLMGSSGSTAMFLSTLGTGSQTYIVFGVSGGASATGSITTNGTGTTYGSSSDYRLKENVAPITNALNKIAQLKPVTYKWKTNQSDGVGFLAHELQSVFPDAVTGEKDQIDADGKEIYQNVDTGSASIIATLTAAIQELNAKVEALEAQLK